MVMSVIFEFLILFTFSRKKKDYFSFVYIMFKIFGLISLLKNFSDIQLETLEILFIIIRRVY